MASTYSTDEDGGQCGNEHAGSTQYDDTSVCDEGLSSTLHVESIAEEGFTSTLHVEDGEEISYAKGTVSPPPLDFFSLYICRR